MPLAQPDSQAIAVLKEFIASLRSGSVPDPQFFQGVKVLEIGLEQVKEDSDLRTVGEHLAEWIGSVPRDFEKPTFEQIIAHLMAITFSLNRRFLRVRLPLQMSREARPQSLQNDLAFLQDYVARIALDRSVIPSPSLQRGLMDTVAGLLKRAGVEIIDDQQMKPDEFCRLPAHRIVLELYKRKHQLGTDYKRGDASLEYRLAFHRLLDPICRSVPALYEFLGVRGLDVIHRESWWTRLRRWIRRCHIELRPTNHESALYSEMGLIAILILLNIMLFLLVWNPSHNDAEQRIVNTKGRIVSDILDRI